MVKNSRFIYQEVRGDDALPLFAGFGILPEEIEEMPVAEISDNKDGLCVRIHTGDLILSVAIGEKEMSYKELSPYDQTEVEYTLGEYNTLSIIERVGIPTVIAENDLTPQSNDLLIAKIEFMKALADNIHNFAKPFLYEGHEQSAESKQAMNRKYSPHGLH